MTPARIAGAGVLPRVPPTLAHLLVEAAEAAPDAEALVCGTDRLIYAEYCARVAGLAGELIARGARRQRVALLLGNSIEMAVASFAVHMAGAQAVLLNPLYTERELAIILEDAAPLLLLHEPATEALVSGLASRFGFATRRVEPGAFARRARSPLPRVPAPDDLATLQYTGGTTGRPKGVNLTHRAIAANIAQREGLLPTGANERILCVTPLFHSYATAMALHLAAYCRGALVILPRYRPQLVLAALTGERITLFPGSPTLFTGLMAHPAFQHTDFSSLRLCYSGSAALPEETLRRWERAVGCKVYEGYGQTEAGPVLTFNSPRGIAKVGSVGQPAPLTEIEIVDVETGTHVLARGERGEIRARGPQIMVGYRNLPEETATTLRDGWLYTGDIGEIDEDGALFIRDRKKDMVIVGGYNVYPREIEEVLMMHPDLVEVAAVGAPDSYRGEVVRAFVVVRPGACLDEAALLAYCAASLARYKVPVSIGFRDSLPKTAVGKIDKAALKNAEYVALRLKE